MDSSAREWIVKIIGLSAALNMVTGLACVSALGLSVATSEGILSLLLYGVVFGIGFGGLGLLFAFSLPIRYRARTSYITVVGLTAMWWAVAFLAER